MANIILTNISKLNERASFANYSTEDIGKIKGRYTNEAPVKYLLNKIYASGPDTDCTIIAVKTKEAETAYKALKNTIKGYCKRKGYENLSIEKIDFTGNFGTVIDQIVNMVKKEDKIYIDTTGGFRGSVYILMAVVRILEYSGIKLEKAVYSVYNNKCFKDNRIIDSTDTYNMFNLINASNSFTSFGNSNELAEFFSECENSDIRKAIEVMNSFSDEVALCRTSKLDNLIAELNEILINIRNTSPSGENEILFKSLSGVISEKFGVREGKKIDYIDVIDWCLDNKMIQQAVTIYAEKIPEYIFDNGLISFKSRLLDRSKFNKNFDENYNMLYNGFLQQLTKITHYPYPLGNLLARLKKDDKVVYKEISTVNDINEFSIKNNLTSDERKGMLNLIRVKNAIFSSYNQKRTDDDIENRKKNNKLSDFVDSDIFYTNAKTSEMFVNKISNSKEYIKLLQGEFTAYTPKVWNATDINVIEHLDRVLNENGGMYSVNNKIDLDDMRKLLRNLIYVRRYVRNSLNHASEENNLSNEYDEYFNDKNYKVDTELSVEEIKTIIRNAIDHIKSL